MERAKFYDTVRGAGAGLFGGHLSQAQVSGIEGILNAFVRFGDKRSKTLAYALATAYHETGTRMVPVREGFAKTDAQARAVVAGRKYGKPAANGIVYYGRGHVQLTWQSNYKDTGDKIGLDLVGNPDLMLDPEISARVLIEGLIDGRWNGKKLGIAHYLPDDGPDDEKNARRTVNVLDRWSDIARYYRAFLRSIDASGGIPKTVVEPAGPQPVPGPTPVPAPMPQPGKPDILPVLLLLLSLIEKRRKAEGKSDAGEFEIIRKVLEQLRGAKPAEPPPLTPINAALGNAIGQPLNGRKTGIGVLGLLATSLLPTLFPENGEAIVKAFDLGAADGAEKLANGTSVLHGIFGALAGWGVLGKAEKWVHLILGNKAR